MSKKRSQYGGGYSQRDARKDTQTSSRKVRQAWHDARGHASKERGWGLGIFKRRHK